MPVAATVFVQDLTACKTFAVVNRDGNMSPASTFFSSLRSVVRAIRRKSRAALNTRAHRGGGGVWRAGGRGGAGRRVGQEVSRYGKT